MNGWIEVESEPDGGSTFKIFLPAMKGSGEVEATPYLAAVQPGSETILLVEDQEDGRGFAKTALMSNGYHVIDAANGAEAIGLSAGHPGPIHMMITDIVMPGMNGRELADHLQAQRPDMKILFMSGYTADVIVQRGIIDSMEGFLAKPFSPIALTATIREVLGRHAGPAFPPVS